MKEILIKVKELFDWKKDLVIPNHIGLTIEGIEEWSEKNNKSYEESYDKAFFNLYKIIQKQFEIGITKLSIHISSNTLRDNNLFSQALIKYLKELNKDENLITNKLKINIIGKWYELDHNIVEPIKELIESTEQFNRYYLDLYINYDGQKEILNACKLIAKKIESNTLKSEDITEQTIQNNLYTEESLPLNLIIKNSNRKINGFMLWNSVNAILYQSTKLWPDFNENELLKAIVEYNKDKLKS